MPVESDNSRFTESVARVCAASMRRLRSAKSAASKDAAKPQITQRCHT
jgi:hypothetical protein